MPHVLTGCLLGARTLQSSLNENLMKILFQFQEIHFKMRLQNVNPFVSAWMCRQITPMNRIANSEISYQTHIRWIYCVYRDQTNTGNESPGCNDTIVDICRDSPSVPITSRPKETLAIAIMSVISWSEHVITDGVNLAISYVLLLV